MERQAGVRGVRPRDSKCLWVFATTVVDDTHSFPTGAPRRKGERREVERQRWFPPPFIRCSPSGEVSTDCEARNTPSGTMLHRFSLDRSTAAEGNTRPAPEARLFTPSLAHRTSSCAYFILPPTTLPRPCPWSPRLPVPGGGRLCGQEYLQVAGGSAREDDVPMKKLTMLLQALVQVKLSPSGPPPKVLHTRGETE